MQSAGERVSGRGVHLLVAALALGAAALTVNRATFSASVTDSSGYLAAADALRAGRLARPVPLQLTPAVRDSGATTTSLGFRRGLVSGTEVPVYALGYPMLMAVAAVIGRTELAMFLVAPLGFAALIAVAYLLAERIAGPLAGIVAAILTALNPIAVVDSIYPMSDVPAAACWLLASYFALRRSWGGAAAAGALVALACMVRPNLLTLAAVPGLLLLLGGRPASPRAYAWGRASLFSALALAGQGVTAWSQYLLYGSPFVPGYPGWETFFQVQHIAANLRQYPASIAQVYGFVPLLGLACAVLPARLLGPAARPVVWAALGLIALNIALYLFYLPYEHWLFLRFFLVGIVALHVLFAGALVVAVRVLTKQSGARGALIALPIALLAASRGVDELRFALGEWQGHARIPMMGHYLREVLPRNAVVLSFVHSGAVTYYTGHNVVSIESLAPQALDPLIRDLERYGCAPVFVVDEALEEREFKAAFATSEYAALDWRPRAEFVTTDRIRYFIAADRERQRRGEQWPTDVLR